MKKPKLDEAVQPYKAVAEIDAAFRKSGLEIRDDMPESERKQAEAAWSLAIHTLGGIAIYLPLRPPSQPQHRKVGRVEAEKKLKKLAATADALVECFTTLSKTAIDALGGPHIRGPIATQCGWLRELSEVARNVEIRDARGRARIKDRRAIHAATIVVDAYEMFTGGRTDMPMSDFAKNRPRTLEPLVRQIFKILGIKADSKHHLDMAANAPRQNQAPTTRKPRTKGTFEDTTKTMIERMRRTELDKISPKNWRRAF